MTFLPNGRMTGLFLVVLLLVAPLSAAPDLLKSKHSQNANYEDEIMWGQETARWTDYADSITHYDRAIQLVKESNLSDRDKNKKLSEIWDKKRDTYEDWPGHHFEAEEAQRQAASYASASRSTGSSGCLIATATFGSPQAQEVQMVRDFRDGQIKQSFTGSRFMQGFDAWYYSYSPSVASYITTHPVARQVVRAVITPLLAIVSCTRMCYSLLAFSPDLAAVSAIVFGSTLIGIVYYVPVMLVLLWFSRRRTGTIPGPATMKPVFAVWAGVLLMVTAGILFRSGILTTLGSALLVVTTIILVSGTISLCVSGLARGRDVTVLQ